MRIEQLQQIAEIRKQRSISKAARQLYMAQPSLSAVLSNFEQELGVKIFQRSPSGVVPTADGEEVLEMIDQILTYVNRLMNFKEEKEALCGEVEILITQAFRFLIADILVEFKKQYPQAILNFRLLLPAEVADWIARGRANIGLTLWDVTPERGPELLRKRNIAYETFCVHKMMLYTSPTHPLAQQPFVEPAELADVQIVVYSAHYWSAINEQVTLTKPPLVINDGENMKRLISGGYAVAVMPEVVAKHDLYLEQDLIVQTPLAGEGVFGMGREYLLYTARKNFSPLEAGVLQILRQILAQNCHTGRAYQS